MTWGFGKTKAYDTELDIKFDMGLESKPFCKWFVTELYRNVLTDCYNKAIGIKEDDDDMFFDSCVTTEAAKGLITLLAEAMESKTKIYLSYDKGVVLAIKDVKEQQDIDARAAKGNLKGAAICDFSSYTKTDLLRVCAGLSYATIKATHTGLNIIQALQVKISKLRESVANSDADRIVADSKTGAKAIKEGKAVLLDKDDEIVIPTYDISPTEKSISLINGLCANFLGGFPLSYVNGALASGGLSTTGEGDDITVNRALKGYFKSVLRPVFKSLTGTTLTFKEDSWRKLDSLSRLIPMLETTDLIDEKRKKEIIDGVFS